MNLSTLYKSAYYLLRARPFPLEKPIVLQFPVIDICNSQCQMCRIWENKISQDLTLDQLRIGLRNPLFSKVASVGLNGGEPTLRKDLGALTAVLFEELPKLRSISIITNAYKHDEVINRITDVGQVVTQHGGKLDLMISLDGLGEVHDRVRGKPGNFERAMHVLEFAHTSPLIHNVRIGCTIIKENVYGLADLFEFCQSKKLYIKYRLGIPHQRLYTQNLLDPYALDAVEKYHIAEFLEGLIVHYEKSEEQKFFYRSLIDQMVHQASRKAGCDWQHRGATITSKGELLYCAVQSKVLGNISDRSIEDRYFGNKDHLTDIIQNHCGKCSHDYVGIPSRGQFAKQLTIKLAIKLNALEPLKNTYRRLFRPDHRRSQQFASSLSQLITLSSIVMTWPSGGVGIRVLVCGWYGTETLGDKGIIGGILQALRELLGSIDVVLVSLFPYVSEMTRRQMSELKGVRIVTCEQGVQLAGQASLVVFGGGPLMAIDQTANMQAIFETAKRAGCKTLVAGCGVGPLGEDWHNEAIGNILKLADARIFRDKTSRDIAAKLGVDVHADIVAEDPAFTWLATQRDALDRKPRNFGRLTLVLGLRDFPYADYARHLSKHACSEAKQRYETSVIEALCLLTSQYPELLIRPLPMCTNHYGNDDRWFYRRLFRGNKEIAPHLDLSLLGAELAPIDYCVAFKQASVALTMRYHSVVFALGLGVPTFAIDYTLGQGKVHALAEAFGIPYRNLDELDGTFIAREIASLLERPRPQALGFVPEFTKAMHAVLPALGFTLRSTLTTP